MIANWWNSLRMQSKLQILTQFFVIIVMLSAQFWIMHRFEDHVFVASEDKTHAIADGVINGANMLMLTGSISNPLHRKAFVEKMTATEGLLELRILRGEPVMKQYGAGLPEEAARDDAERRVLGEGKILVEPGHTPEGKLTMRAIVPFIASRDFRGTNCLQCHTHAREGDILGAASMVVNLEKDQQSLATLNGSLWVGQVVIQVLLFLIIGAIARAITRPAKVLQTVMQSIEHDGDLQRRVHNESHDEIGETTHAFNALMEHFQDIIRQVNLNADEVTRAAENLSRTTRTVNEGSEQQSQLAVAVAAAAEEIRASISQVAEGTREAAELSDRASELSGEGSRIVNESAREIARIADAVSQAQQVIAALGERAERISGMVSSIKQIADQTNLLALNAAIEAARAGEQGRGFAVVADEVRNLAARTAQATQDITEMTESIQLDTRKAVDRMLFATEQVGHGVELGQQAAAALDQINDGARRTVERVSQIANAMREQTAASGEIAQNIHRIVQMADANGHAVANTASALGTLQNLAQALHERVSRFKA